MDTLASTWEGSGKQSADLYHGSDDDLIQEMRAWVTRRKQDFSAYKKAQSDLSYDIALHHPIQEARRHQSRESMSVSYDSNQRKQAIKVIPF